MKKKYHFESTHVPYSVVEIDVEVTSTSYSYTVDGVDTEINTSERFLRRSNGEMEMYFNFKTNEAYVELRENNSKLMFEIVTSDLVVEDSVLHLDFKYILDEEEMFTSISIV